MRQSKAMPRAEYPPNTYYIHPAGASGPSVLVNLDLVESLAQWASYAASQSQEIHGVLFGRVDAGSAGPAVLVIEDCEPIKDELPAHTEGLRAIGLVRSDLSGTLLPDDDDRVALRRMIADPNRVLLLVKPGPETTARILPDGAAGSAPFPLQRIKLAQDGRRTLRIPSMRTAGAKGMAAILLVAALGGGTMLLLRLNSDPAPAKQSDVSLVVRADGPAYSVSWDPNSAKIRRAGSAVLHVMEGDSEDSVAVDAKQLMAGETTYRGRGLGALFRLELRGSAPVSPAPSPQPAAALNDPKPPAGTAKPPDDTQEPEPVADNASRLSPREVHVAKDRSAAARIGEPASPGLLPPFAEADRRVADPGERHADEPVQRAEHTSSPPQPNRPANAVALTAALKPPTLTAIVSYRAAPESGFRRGIQKIPGLRSLQHWRYKEGDNFKPARPVHEAKPWVPERIAPTLPASARIELEVFLDSTGKVSGVEIATPGANDHLIGAATNAVYGSSFQAATLNGKPVDSRLIASFDFRKTS